MGEMIFDQKALINGNIFKFEDRLHSKLNRFTSNGSVLVDYYSQDDTSITVDRGTQNIDQLFGKNSPLRYNKIIDLPINGLTSATPENTDEIQIEDINVDGDCVILPSTVVPKSMDFFVVKHLKMCALFEVTEVSYDSMKVDGFYKIRYHLHSTSPATLEKLERQLVKTYHTDMNEIGGTRDAVILEDDFIYREKVLCMVNTMIDSYRAMFYNRRHNCFLYHDRSTGLVWFDMCGNEFIAKYGLLNPENSMDVILLHEKIDDPKLPLYYQQSIYRWMEMQAPPELVHRFPFRLVYADKYLYSSFVQWNDGDVQVITPVPIQEAHVANRTNEIYYTFTAEQLNGLLDEHHPPKNQYEALLWNYMYNKHISIHDVSLHLGDVLFNAMDGQDIYLLTPILIYIIREILTMK